MPKQQINRPAYQIATPLVQGSTTSAKATLTGWSLRAPRDGESLEKAELTPTLFIGWPKRVEDAPGNLTFMVQVSAEEVLRAADRIRQIFADHWTFETAPVTRDEANALIRTARRARDAVFGADE